MSTQTLSALRSGRYILGGATFVDVEVKDRRTWLVFGKDNRVEVTRASYRGGRWHITYHLGTVQSENTLEKVTDPS